jgi:hypothetical protein
MAVLGYGTNVTLQWENGVSDKVALYAVKGVNTGDTINISQDFISCGFGFMIVITPSQGSAVPSMTGTTVTIPAGMTNVAGYILVYGESA